MLSTPARAVATGALIGLLLLSTVVLVLPRTAQAQFLVADVVHTAQTIVHYIGRIVEISQKYTQIYNQYRQLYYDYQRLIHDLQNLKKLDRYWARNVVGTMDRMERLLQRTHLPSRANPQVGSTHDRVYPGWELPRDWWTEEELAAETTLEVFRETLRAKHEAHRTAVDHIRTLLELKQQVKEIEGHEEALEVLAGIAAFQAEVATLAQVSADTSADADTSFFSYLVSRLSRGERAMKEAIFTSELDMPMAEPGSGWGASPGWWR